MSHFNHKGRPGLVGGSLPKNNLQKLFLTLKGSSKSGNFGHAGRKGKRGGSTPGHGIDFSLPEHEVTAVLMSKIQSGKLSGSDAIKIQEDYRKSKLAKVEEKPMGDTLTTSEMSAVNDYTWLGSQGVNERLRKGQDTSADADTIKGLDSITNRFSLQKDQQLYRGIEGYTPVTTQEFLAGKKNPTPLSETLKVGSVFDDKGFVSASKDINRAKIGTNDPILFKISTKKGQKGADLSGTSRYPQEGEILLPRGSKFKVNSISKNNDGVTEVEVEYL